MRGEFSLGFSWMELGLRVVCSGLAVGAPWFSAVPVWFAVLLSGLLVVMVWQGSAVLRPATRLRGFVLYEDHAVLLFRSGVVTVAAPRVLLLWEVAVILRFYELPARGGEQGRKVRHQVVIWPDMLSGEQHRNLRRILRSLGRHRA